MHLLVYSHLSHCLNHILCQNISVCVCVCVCLTLAVSHSLNQWCMSSILIPSLPHVRWKHAHKVLL